VGYKLDAQTTEQFHLSGAELLASTTLSPQSLPDTVPRLREDIVPMKPYYAIQMTIPSTTPAFLPASLCPRSHTHLQLDFDQHLPATKVPFVDCATRELSAPPPSCPKSKGNIAHGGTSPLVSFNNFRKHSLSSRLTTSRYRCPQRGT
jgi:hypothetical protein